MMRFIKLSGEKQIFRPVFPVLTAIFCLIVAILEARNIKKTSEKTLTIIFILSCLAYAFLVVTSRFEIIAYSDTAEEILRTVVCISLLGSTITRDRKQKHSEGAEKQEANRAADHADDRDL